MTAPPVLLLVHAAATWLMLGVILVVQLVHYPLFAGVGADGWAAYADGHRRRITWIVLPAMTVELVTAVWLVAAPHGLPPWTTWTGLALIGLLWLSTGLVQVPLHNRLHHAFDPAAHRRLVRTNWIRTAAWTARGLLAGWMLVLA